VVVLDTHAWIWWNDDPERLSERARDLLVGAGSIGIAAISCWEVGMLVLGGRISLDRDVGRWVEQALTRPGLEAIPISPRVALDAAKLEREGFVPDPADRLIYATARDRGARLITRDLAIREFDPRNTIW
jgi:PIN domain nuclease of toxin-antitoxin system